MHGLSLYHQPICLWRLEAIEGWITADKNHIMFASPLADDMRVLHSHALSYCGVWATCSRGLCGVIWGISNAVFTNERTLAIDGEADSAPSAAIEQNKCVGIATATYDVWKRTMDPNNQSGWLHNLWPTNYVVNQTGWWTQIWTVDR